MGNQQKFVKCVIWQKERLVLTSSKKIAFDYIILAVMWVYFYSAELAYFCLLILIFNMVENEIYFRYMFFLKVKMQLKRKKKICEIYEEVIVNDEM